MAHTPAVVLLDEPSSGIAQRETEALGPLIRRLRDELGCSILVIEHDMPLIRRSPTAWSRWNRARLLAEGPPSAVMTHPGVVESYLGSSAELIARSGARAADDEA